MDLNLTRDEALAAFAAAVGSEGPVTVAGGRTKWTVGGDPAPGTREVVAPAGVFEYDPAEMVVRCGAGTTVAHLHEILAGGGQVTPLPDDDLAATVGGVLAVGRSGIRRLRYGPVRDALLEARFVNAEGVLVKAGGPVVKNVTGFDLCRLLVGSLGTIGLIGEVVLRCLPTPVVSEWRASVGVDPFEVHRSLFRPSTILWDGMTTWVLLEGSAAEVAGEAASLPPSFTVVDGPPALPTGGRSSLRPSQLRDLTGTFVAEIGVGVVHTAGPVAAPPVDPSTVAIHRRIKDAFDPTGRLNPGRLPVGMVPA